MISIYTYFKPLRPNEERNTCRRLHSSRMNITDTYSAACIMLFRHSVSIEPKQAQVIPRLVGTSMRPMYSPKRGGVTLRCGKLADIEAWAFPHAASRWNSAHFSQFLQANNWASSV